MIKAFLVGLGIPAAFRLFSGPFGDFSFTELPRKKFRQRIVSRRAKHNCYGGYSVHLTASQRIRRVES